MKKIVWDWNGTLFNDLHLCFSCINRLLENHSLQPLPDIDAYRNVFGFPIVDYYDTNLRNFMLIPFDEYNSDFEVSHYLYNTNFNRNFINSTYESVIDLEFRNSVY